jgi:phosphopantetheinyl transferase
MWTLKEAYVKCAGTGASLDFKDLNTSLEPPAVVADHRDGDIMTPCKFSQHMWDPGGETHWVTVAARRRIRFG